MQLLTNSVEPNRILDQVKGMLPKEVVPNLIMSFSAGRRPQRRQNLDHTSTITSLHTHSYLLDSPLDVAHSYCTKSLAVGHVVLTVLESALIDMTNLPTSTTVLHFSHSGFTLRRAFRASCIEFHIWLVKGNCV